MARAAIDAAIEASRAAGHELTFVIADTDDWPRHLYEKLGFEPVGEISAFRLNPSRRPHA